MRLIIYSLVLISLVLGQDTLITKKGVMYIGKVTDQTDTYILFQEKSSPIAQRMPTDKISRVGFYKDIENNVPADTTEPDVVNAKDMKIFQFEFYSMAYNLSGEIYEAGDYSSPKGFGFDFMFTLHKDLSGLIGMGVAGSEPRGDENGEDESDASTIFTVPIGLRYKYEIWKVRSYLKVNYNILTSYQSDYTEDRVDQNSTISGPFVGNSFGAAIGANYMITEWLSIGAEIGYSTTNYDKIRLLDQTYKLHSTYEGSELYFRIPTIALTF